MPKGNPKASRGLRGFVSEYLHTHPGEEIFLGDLAAAAHDKGYTWGERQIQTAVGNAMRDGALKGVEVMVRGRSWRYLPNKVDTGKRMFEEIGVSRAGKIVIQDSEGNIYVAEEL